MVNYDVYRVRKVTGSNINYHKVKDDDLCIRTNISSYNDGIEFRLMYFPKRAGELHNGFRMQKNLGKIFHSQIEYYYTMKEFLGNRFRISQHYLGGYLNIGCLPTVIFDKVVNTRALMWVSSRDLYLTHQLYPSIDFSSLVKVDDLK
jgi:hypothetical protein